MKTSEQVNNSVRNTSLSIKVHVCWVKTQHSCKIGLVTFHENIILPLKGLNNGRLNLR